MHGKKKTSHIANILQYIRSSVQITPVFLNLVIYFTVVSVSASVHSDVFHGVNTTDSSASFSKCVIVTYLATGHDE